MRRTRVCRYGEKRLTTRRPKHIENRERWGNWEGDTMEFFGTKTTLVTTLVERKSRMVFLIKNHSKYCSEVMTKISQVLTGLPQKICRT